MTIYKEYYSPEEEVVWDYRRLDDVVERDTERYRQQQEVVRDYHRQDYLVKWNCNYCGSANYAINHR